MQIKKPKSTCDSMMRWWKVGHDARDKNSTLTFRLCHHYHKNQKCLYSSNSSLFIYMYFLIPLK